MPRTLVDSILGTLSVAVGLPVADLAEFPTTVRHAALVAVADGEPAVECFSVDERDYLACRYHRQRSAVAVLGPFRRVDGGEGDAPLLDESTEARLVELLRSSALPLGQALEDQRQRVELTTQLEVVGRAALAISGELALGTVLRRIVDLARELAGAKYVALGVPDEHGNMLEFITSGMTEEEEARMAHRPRGRGLLGSLLREPRTIRLADLSTHPASSGFPANHPPMKSFLGVPIIARGRVLGNLYLTEKRTAPEFTDADARIVELLARHAAVAIENARLYEAVEGQQRHLQALLDQMPEAVILAEPNPERISLANRQAAHVLGWTIETPIPLDAFLAANGRYDAQGRQLSPADTPIVRALRLAEVFERHEMRFSRRDGSSVTVLVNTAPIVDDHGHVQSAVAIFQDITQIKDAEQLKDDFLSLVSHELRTPLTTIQGGALMLQRDWQKLDRELQEEFLNDISTESRRLAILIENMVQLANIRAGRMRMETEPVLIGALVENAVVAVRSLAPEREFRLRVEPGLLAEADPGRIDQVLRNLLHNSVKYSPVDTPIDVSARGCSDGEAVEIGVRDYGRGIAEGEAVLVFERFQRTEGARRSNAPGMGLGLYLSRHVVEAHGGHIWIEHPEGGGARVLFTLPAINDDEA
jgi:PAS domain S-box-containing protein